MLSGYANYPDNVIEDFVKKAAESGMDIFRVFDPLNWDKRPAGRHGGHYQEWSRL